MDTKSIATIAGAAAAGGVLAFAGLSLASAATGSDDTRTGPPGMTAGQYPGMGGPMGQSGPGMGPRGTPVTGEAADKVTAAVQEKYPDSSVMFVEEEDGGYEAHVRKSDGTMVHVTLGSDFQVTGEHAGPPMGGPGGPGGMGPGGGEEPLTGQKADKVTAAAVSELPGATVVRVETDADGVYEAHVLKSDGTPVIVTVNKNFTVTGVEEMPQPGEMGAPPAGSGPQGTTGNTAATGV